MSFALHRGKIIFHSIFPLESSRRSCREDTDMHVRASLRMRGVMHNKNVEIFRRTPAVPDGRGKEISKIADVGSILVFSIVCFNKLFYIFSKIAGYPFVWGYRLFYFVGGHITQGDKL
jgi:hypothetical protein